MTLSSTEPRCLPNSNSVGVVKWQHHLGVAARNIKVILRTSPSLQAIVSHPTQIRLPICSSYFIGIACIFPQDPQTPSMVLS